MKTTYKNIPLPKKGYPAYFWIAYAGNGHHGCLRNYGRKVTRQFCLKGSLLLVGLHLSVRPTSGRGTMAEYVLPYQSVLIGPQPLVAQSVLIWPQPQVAQNALIGQQSLIALRFTWHGCWFTIAGQEKRKNISRK